MVIGQERASTSSQVYRVLRGRILALDLVPGAALGEQALAAELRVSRTPVREALSRLAADGLVEIFPNKGAIVAPIRTAAVMTAQFVREALEVAVARDAISRITPVGTFELRQAIAEQRLAETEGAPELFYRADERMHRTIADIAGRRMVWSYIEDTKMHMDRARRLNLIEIRSFGPLIAQHEAIVSAIEDGDAERVERSVRRHLRTILPDLERLHREHPAYFADDEIATSDAREPAHALA